MGTNQDEIVGQMVGQPGQAEQSDTSTPEVAANNTTEYVSKADFEKSVDERLNRALQSWSDKTVSKTEKVIAGALAKIEDVITTNRSMGMEITDDQAEVMRDKALKQALRQIGTPEPSKSQTPAQGQQAQQGAPDPVTQTANLLLQSEQVIMESGDPLWKMVKTDAASPAEYLKSVMDMIGAYKDRQTKATKSQAAVPSQMARGGQTGGEVESVIAELSKLIQHPTAKDLKRITELKEKLNKLGD